MTPAVEGPGQITTVLGDWYAIAWFWKPQLALLVNERAFLPVVMPLHLLQLLPSGFLKLWPKFCLLWIWSKIS